MARLEPKAGKKYEYDTITVEDRELAVDKVGQTVSDCVRKLNEMGNKGWFLIEDVHIGANRNVLFLVREKVS